MNNIKVMVLTILAVLTLWVVVRILDHYYQQEVWDKKEPNNIPFDTLHIRQLKDQMGRDSIVYPLDTAKAGGYQIYAPKASR